MSNSREQTSSSFLPCKWLNFAKLLAALHTHFSEQSAIFINDPTVVSFTQEVALLQSTTVLIAHNGAISANLIFLPDLATAIVHDVWSAHVGSTRMEQDGHLYAALGHIRVLFYTVKSDEIPEPTSHSPEESPTLVNVARMTELIRYGLQQTVLYGLQRGCTLHRPFVHHFLWRTAAVRET